MFDWAVAGVNVSIPGEGGPECAAYMPMHIRIFESVVALGIALRVLICSRNNPSFKNIPRFSRSETTRRSKSCDNVIKTREEISESGISNLEEKYVTNASEPSHETSEQKIEKLTVYSSSFGGKSSLLDESLSDRNKKHWLLVLLCLVWGAEIGFKFASRTVIFLLNPCHVVTAVQIYLLAAEPSFKVTVIFRFHLYFLNGAVLAFLFPNTESRILPCESSLYWIQHSMMLVVPMYLLCLKGVYNVEPLRDLSWGVVGFAMNMVYHFAFLQPIALISEVNLNQLLCPAQLDPFRGNYYRTAAVIHQSIFCPLVAKACCICVSFLASAPVYSDYAEEHPPNECNTFSCDTKPCQTSGKSTPKWSSVAEYRSWLEKQVTYMANVDRELGGMLNQLTKSEADCITTETDSVIPSKEITEHTFNLRQRNLIDDVDKS